MIFKSFKKPTKVKPVDLKTQISEYYEQANGWAYDCFDAVVESRNRYKVAFCVTSGVAGLLALAICCMMPLKTVSPILIRTDSNGVVWVQNPHVNTKFDHNLEETKSEIYRYIKYREGYDPEVFKIQSDYVRAMSSPSVLSDYGNELDGTIKELGAGRRKIVVESVQPLPNQKNVAMVTFTTHDDIGGIDQVKHMQAMLKWVYRGLPKDTDEQFMNYDGFTVVSYNKSQINFK